jgi:Amt family ammonium transporter
MSEAGSPTVATTSAPSDIDVMKVNVDHFFLLVNGMIVFLMQAGFAFLEAGSVR